MLDIGANIGAITMFWAAGRPDILFHAYEPNPQSSATLRKNITANHLSAQVRIFSEALSGSRDPIELLIDVPTHLSSSYGNAPTGDGRTIADIGRKIQVPAITLDDAWERTSRARIWMLKIDVEGAEADILEAASNDMLANVENACVEWHNNIVPGVRERCIRRLEFIGLKWRERVHPWNEGIIFAGRTPALQ